MLEPQETSAILSIRSSSFLFHVNVGIIALSWTVSKLQVGISNISVQYKACKISVSKARIVHCKCMLSKLNLFEQVFNNVLNQSHLTKGWAITGELL